MKPSFRRLVSDSERGAIVAPLIKMYLEKGELADVNIQFGSPQRTPDGYFHPSSHPTKSAPELYTYLTDPERYYAQQDPFGAEARMSVTVGTILHEVVQAGLRKIGIWELPQGKCPCCHRNYGFRKGQCNEPGVADETLGRRGHLDGILDLSNALGKRVVWDLKTQNGFAFSKAEPGLEYFKKTTPHYWAQQQEYMALSGLDEAIVDFLQIGYPWELREVRIPRDDEYIASLEAKYRRVRDAVAAGIMPGEEQ